MGVQHSHLYTVNPADKAAHRAVEKLLKEEKHKLAQQHRVLLLGSGDSGKSTVLKQMRLIHSHHFSPSEIETFRQLIFANLTDGMRLVFAAMRELTSPRTARDPASGRAVYLRDSFDLAIEAKNLRFARMVEDAPDIKDDEPFPPEYEEALRALWADDGVQRVRARGNEVALPENLGYFFSRLERLFSPTYQPTTADILRVRVRTIGISELILRPQRNPASELVVIDVGGQLNERRKWIHCFEDVECVIYLASLSGYDQCLAEDRGTNQMDDALVLWSQICLSPWFKKASLILFLNKEDLFRDKIASSPIKRTFPDYDGPDNDIGAAKAFFKRRFIKLARVSERAAYNRLVLGRDAPGARQVVGLGCSEDNRRSVKARPSVPSLLAGAKGNLKGLSRSRSGWGGVGGSASAPSSPTTGSFPEEWGMPPGPATPDEPAATSKPAKSSPLAAFPSLRKPRGRVDSTGAHRAAGTGKPSKKERMEMLKEKENATRSAPAATTSFDIGPVVAAPSAAPPTVTRHPHPQLGRVDVGKPGARPFSAQRQIFAHFTNATDTALLRVIMGAVEDLSIRAHLAEQALL